MNKKIIQNSELIVNVDVECTDGEENEFAVVFDIDEERMFYLNSTSYEIFKIFASPLRMDSAVEYFCNNYDMNEEDLMHLRNTIYDMLDKHIIKYSE